ncbi:cbb3-type cytochrome c oxidase subunit I [sulfur-oxidizing endosymbiont of Gigantopelta aegis]|uniref:cbb3-type cytochrome c oxidase subunit I n=1 Tax=sulfur-oxidizing endosymbiont of Gigantopelta aegis TaxID=2794934 RepID=UPI0018DE20AB|nr:cbb3-type cytochrome c oxidase subunit I [sulfur-oxidizing endosymbiont of Gigantopelta aegis]
MESNYILPVEKEETKRLAKAWFFLGVVSLLLSGFFSILLVVSRTPAIQSLIPFIDFFHTALVVHVDLSVLIWFTSFASILWTLIARNVNKLDWLAFYLSVSGTFLIVLTPFIMDGHPLMNNYIPILQTPLFYFALSLYTVGLLIRIVRTLFSSMPFNASSPTTALTSGVWLGALAALLAILFFLYTLFKVPDDLPAVAWFEVLFWGGGHILQFTHMLLVFVVWIVLLQQIKTRLIFTPAILFVCLLISFIPVLYSGVIYWQYDVASSEFHNQFTQLMRFGSLTTLPLGLIIFINLFKTLPAEGPLLPLKLALWCSAALFASGGVLGFMIEGVNVVIPAHYHGSIVGITLAFMGFSFYLLPVFDYPLKDRTLKLAKIQPIVYAVGQFMHISGLAWSGGYGVKRKTAGAAQGLDSLPEIAGMALMGMGGLIAIIGGILFVVIVYLAVKQKKG